MRALPARAGPPDHDHLVRVRHRQPGHCRPSHHRHRRAILQPARHCVVRGLCSTCAAPAHPADRALFVVPVASHRTAASRRMADSCNRMPGTIYKHSRRPENHSGCWMPPPAAARVDCRRDSVRQGEPRQMAPDSDHPSGSQHRLSQEAFAPTQLWAFCRPQAVAMTSRLRPRVAVQAHPELSRRSTRPCSCSLTLCQTVVGSIQLLRLSAPRVSGRPD